ncbi:MAG: phosphoribosyltransferase domain-containing protein [Gloeobacteraceae cyanobacterium ES-bin-144]|nr:phosphoribosyltransferase domain-containing protein [Verrucomicrobiales bacterium]
MYHPESTSETESSVFTFQITGRSRGQLGTPLDGRYGAMVPAQLRSAIAKLIPRVNLEGVDYIIGIPEGGLIPAYEFAVSSNIKLVLASHSQPAAPGFIRFIEPHMHADSCNNYVYGLKSGDKVVVVEDEVTTGATMSNCVTALRNAGVICNDVVSIYAADDASMLARLRAENIQLHYLWNFSKKTVDDLYQKHE